VIKKGTIFLHLRLRPTTQMSVLERFRGLVQRESAASTDSPQVILETLTLPHTEENVPRIVEMLRLLSWRVYESVNADHHPSEVEKEAAEFALDLDALKQAIYDTLVAQHVDVSAASLAFVRQLLDARPADFGRHVPLFVPGLVELVHRPPYIPPDTPVSPITTPTTEQRPSSLSFLKKKKSPQEVGPSERAEVFPDTRAALAERALGHALNALNLLEIIPFIQLKDSTGKVREGFAEMLAVASDTHKTDDLKPYASSLVEAIQVCALSTKASIRQYAVRMYLALAKMDCSERTAFEEAMPKQIRMNLVSGLRADLTEKKLGLDRFDHGKFEPELGDGMSVASAPALRVRSQTVNTPGDDKKKPSKLANVHEEAAPTLSVELQAASEFSTATWSELSKFLVSDTASDKDHTVYAVEMAHSNTNSTPTPTTTREKSIARSKSDQALRMSAIELDKPKPKRGIGRLWRGLWSTKANE
jgi:hypothetical protein